MTNTESPQQTATSVIEQALQQAIVHHQAGQLQEAERLYQAILQIQPNHSEANHNMGVLAVQMKQPAAGLPYFMAALDADPARGQYWLNYIDALFQAGQLEDARQVLALAQQQGLQGVEVEALAVRLESGVQAAGQSGTEDQQASGESLPVVSATLQNSKEPSKTKPVKPDNPASKSTSYKGQTPSPKEINKLMDMFTSGRHKEAAALAQEMTARFPEHGFGWKVWGVVLHQMGRIRDALAPMQKAAALSPGDAEAHYNLGNTLRDLVRLDEAEASYRRALQIKPDYIKAYSNLGSTLKDLGRLDEAEASYRQVLQIKPDWAEAHYNLGNTLKDLGRLNEAEASHRRALDIKPDYAEAHNNLGFTLKDMGRLDEAEASYHRALQAKPDFVDGRYNLAQVKKAKPGDANLVALAAIWEAAQRGTTPLPDKEAMPLHFALGKSYDDTGDYEKAFPHFLEGNRLKRATFDYDPNRTVQLFAKIMRNLDAVAIDRLRGGGDPSHVPIFVLGMPRSGTTLIEQIIASHPDVHGAGELPDLMAIARRNVAGAAFPDNLRSLDQARLSAWGTEYVAGLRRRAPAAQRITDKLPGNFMAAGPIHLMLPNAKIIHVNRNPVDTCLSCFTTLFEHKHEHTYDLAELGRYYAGYARLMEHWREVLPAGAFLDVQYEDIVADQEAQSRRIIEYCGLEWNDACLDFHRNERSVSTASAMQVRQPMYKTSVERWRHYEKFLGPLLDTLGDLAPGR